MTSIEERLDLLERDSLATGGHQHDHCVELDLLYESVLALLSEVQCLVEAAELPDPVKTDIKTTLQEREDELTNWTAQVRATDDDE